MDNRTLDVAALRGAGIAVRAEPGADRIVQGEGPQLVSILTEHVRSLHELSVRLSKVTRQLRGTLPAPAAGQSAANEKVPEIHLANLTATIGQLLEACHQEATEISALLT